MADRSEQTEKPTPQRLEKARKEGQFASSRDFVGAVQFLIFAVLVNTYMSEYVESLKQTFRRVLERSGQVELAPEQALFLARMLISRVMTPLAVGGALMVAASLAIQLATTQLGWSFKRLQPTVQKFSPIAKMRELPKQNLAALAQMLLVLIVLGGIVVALVMRNAEIFAQLPLGRLETGIKVWAGSVSSLIWKAAAVFLLVGCLDLVRQKRQFQSQMRMSKKEIKDEIKQSDGNPLIKARIRRIQRDLRRRRMMSQVATATAVIVNPTHFAVALRYEPETMAAPLVVAKGKNYLALRIKEKAREHRVPIVENPPMAQALYKSVEVGQAIPPAFYRAVAEILAYIHRLMNSFPAGGTA